MMRYAAVLTLCLFAFIFPPVTEGGTGNKHFVKYTSALSWNQAREVCRQGGMELAVPNKFATAFLQHVFSLQPQHNTDNIWISLRDSAQIEGSVGAAGFIWYKCRSYHWTNWATGEPADRWNNWCVRLLYQQELKWQPEQCLSQAQFLCQKARGLCDKFVNADEAGCNITASNLKAVMNDSLSDYNCSVACLEHSSYHARCWVYTYSAQHGCVLYVGLNPVYCNRSSAGTGGQGSTNGSVRWVKECYTLSYNHSTDLDVTNYTSPYALDGCVNFEITTSVADPTTESMSSSTPTSLSLSATTEETTSPSSPTAATQQTTLLSTTTTTQQITASSPPSATTQQITSPSSVASSSPATTQQIASSSVPVTTTSGILSNSTSQQAVYNTSMPETQTSSTSPLPSSSSPPPKTTTTTTTPPTTTATATTTRKPCGCRCSFRQHNVSISKATEAAQELRRELMLDKTKLSATRRQKESVMDSRPSVLATGGVGVAILVGVMCLIVVPDLLALCRIINHS